MAILFMEGFDGWQLGTSTATVTAAARGLATASGDITIAAGGRVGGGRYLISPTDFGAYLAPCVGGAGLTEATIGGAFYSPSDSNYAAPFILTTTEGITLKVTINLRGACTVAYNPSGTDNDFNADFYITPSAWNYIEVSWSPTLVSIYVNNVLATSKAGTFPPLQAALPFKVGGKAIYIDDLYVTDSATPLGEVYVRTLPLGTDVALTGTVTGGTTAAGVWPSFDNATSYVNLATVGKRASTTLGDITDNPTTIHAVQVTSSTNKTDVGDAKFDIKLKTASENTAASVTPITAWAGYRSIVELDPHDSAAWTKAKVNSLEVGLTRVTP